jgi:hypothetical protein
MNDELRIQALYPCERHAASHWKCNWVWSEKFWSRCYLAHKNYCYYYHHRRCCYLPVLLNLLRRKSHSCEIGSCKEIGYFGCWGRSQSGQITKRPDPHPSFLVNGTAPLLTCFLRRPSQSRNWRQKDILSASSWLLGLYCTSPYFHMRMFIVLGNPLSLSWTFW